ncbi:B-cell receptor CD22-like [Anomaloglossus baeobatrachus]|uniref:B-cell receptor CD22-like n=1 Tax=Anomaloglossus baeobatrachus TaxID=238106 RepID=UPI003F4F814D
MDPTKQIYLLLICQGFYLGSLCQRWTFPEKITGLIDSCVEIPCTYHPDGRSGASGTVWYLYNTRDYPQILNTKDSSTVMEEYKERTSLVAGNNSCTLRINPVRREDGNKYYYPGIAEDRIINTADKQNKYVHLSVTDPETIQLLGLNIMTEGVSTTLRCRAVHTCRSSPPSLQWNKPGQVLNQFVEISGGSWRQESNLTYIPSYVDDGTIIQCTATYINGITAKGSGTLNINYAPKNVKVMILKMGEFMEGNDVPLQCSSSSKPAANKYEWFKGKDKTKLPDIGREITVRNVTRVINLYSCAAINDVGQGESALMEIPVLHSPIGVHIKVKKGREFNELICDFLSSRPDVTHYTWRKDGTTLSETMKNLIVGNDEESSGQYSCIAHNTVGNSTSEEIFYKGEKLDLALILGSVAGVFLLLFLILIIYFCLRQNKKSASPTSPIHGTVSHRIPYHETVNNKDDNLYGNIQSNHQAKPSSIRLEYMVNVNIDENHAIYCNSDVLHPSNEVEYSVIAHGPNDQDQNPPSRVRQSEVEYTVVKR